MSYPPIDEFNRLPAAERRRILAEMHAETAELGRRVSERVEQLRALGATEQEIVRDYRGDPSVGIKYGLDRPGPSAGPAPGPIVVRFA